MKKLCEIAQGYVIASTMNRSTFGMPQYNNRFSSCNFARKLHTSQNIFVDDVACNTKAENIAYTRVKYQFGRRARINTTQYHCHRILTQRSSIYLMSKIF